MVDKELHKNVKIKQHKSTKKKKKKQVSSASKKNRKFNGQKKKDKRTHELSIKSYMKR